MRGKKFTADLIGAALGRMVLIWIAGLAIIGVALISGVAVGLFWRTLRWVNGW